MSATIESIREAVSLTREARERVQQHRTTDAVIAVLTQVAKNWLDPNSVWRKQAVEYAPQHTGFSEETGCSISMEGKSASCAHFSPIGNIASAMCDLWSNESVQNVRLLSGSAPEIGRAHV